MPANSVFLFDVDNTLLDNDHVTADLKRHLQTNVGAERAQRYWQLFEDIRSELGYADYWARCSAIGSSIRTIRTCWRCLIS